MFTPQSPNFSRLLRVVSAEISTITFFSHGLPNYAYICKMLSGQHMPKNIKLYRKLVTKLQV
jgi:hypothetical protein